MTHYKLSNTLVLFNPLTGNKYTQNADRNEIRINPEQGTIYRTIAEFIISDIHWNDSSKDMDEITLTDNNSTTSYKLPANKAALKNKIYNSCLPTAGGMYCDDKKYLSFAVNEYLYEYVLLLVYNIGKGALDDYIIVDKKPEKMEEAAPKKSKKSSKKSKAKKE